MVRNYVAFGLQLEASFALVGMTVDEMPDLPVLRLDSVSPRTLDDTWNGSTGPPAWKGRLGDGCSLTIELGTSGDVMYTYCRRGRYRFDVNERRIECEALRDELDCQRVLIGKILPSVSVMLGYEALHAGVVDSPGGVVALLGPSGAGKSTLIAELLGRGWRLFADDELTLGRRDAEVWAHPGSPHMNVALEAPLSRDVATLGRTISTFSNERWLTTDQCTSRPRRVRAICWLSRARGSALAARPLPASPTHLVPYMLGLSTDSGRRRARFRLYADLVEESTLLQLSADPKRSPRELADTLQAALDTQSPTSLEMLA